jgi:hypothetical protein
MKLMMWALSQAWWITWAKEYAMSFVLYHRHGEYTEGFELRRTNIRKRLTADLDCPTPVYLKAPLASPRAPMRLRDLLLEASESIPLPNSRRNLLYILSAELVA